MTRRRSRPGAVPRDLVEGAALRWVLVLVAVVVVRDRLRGRTAAGKRAHRPVRPVLAVAPLPAEPPPHPHRRFALRALTAMSVAALLVAPWLLPGMARSFVEWVDGPAASASVPARTVDPVVPEEPPEALPGTVLSGPTDAQLRGWRRPAGRPLGVEVPRLGVSSTVLPISGDDGELLPPPDPLEIGWWQEGPVAGAAHGATVLTGHTVHTGGGAFDHVDELLPGDLVRVRTARGELRYRVVTVHRYRTGALARHAAAIFTLTGPSRLRLITCSGWTGSVYLDNTVVTAVPSLR